MTDDKGSRPPPPTRKEAREVRLAQELRANLARRKALSRARSAPPQSSDIEGLAEDLSPAASSDDQKLP